MDDSFWTGFEKVAKIFSSLGSAITKKPVAQKLLSGSEFVAKLEAHRAARAAQKATQSASKNLSQKALANASQNAVKNIKQQYSQRALNQFSNMTPSSQFRKALAEGPEISQ